MRTPAPQCSGPSVPLVESEENPGNTEGDPDIIEQTAEGDIQVDYSSDWFYSPSIGAGTKIALRRFIRLCI
jgi:hypothetical protein